MNNKIKAIIAALSLSAPTLLVAQDAAPEGGRPEIRRPHRPAPAVVLALDANKDGTIDATEIANAAQVLMALDKNGDGSLTPDEFIGAPRPAFGKEAGAGEQGHARPQGPRGPRGPRPGPQN